MSLCQVFTFETLKLSFLQINESYFVVPTMGASQAHLSAFNCCALWPWVYHHHQSYLFYQEACLFSNHYFLVERNFSTSEKATLNQLRLIVHQSFINYAFLVFSKVRQGKISDSKS